MSASLTARMIEALADAYAGDGILRYTVAGYVPCSRGGASYHSFQTVSALEKRGMLKVANPGKRSLALTEAGLRQVMAAKGIKP